MDKEGEMRTVNSPINNTLHDLMEEWREGELSDREAATAFRAIALVAVAEHDAAVTIMENWKTDDDDEIDWRIRHRSLVEALHRIGQNVSADAEYVVQVHAAVGSAHDFLVRTDTQ